jgi:hypothetical protein
MNTDKNERRRHSYGLSTAFCWAKWMMPTAQIRVIRGNPCSSVLPNVFSVPQAIGQDAPYERIATERDTAR